jgi:polar amino acid transport system substrate-binding protein
MRAHPRLAVLAVTLLALTACSPQPAAPRGPLSATASCGKDQLRTLTAGRLTLGTDEPAYPPWFVDDKPDNGQGFEGAVAYAVATKLGYAKADVVWTRVTFNAAIAPGPKPFDFAINEFSVSAERQQAVDFSSPYYDITQAVIALKTSKIAGAKSVADLKGAKLGAQVGTTSFRAITDVVKPTTEPAVFNNNDDAKKKLSDGAIDGLVLDLPTAFFVTSAEIDNSVIIGQLPQPSGQPEQLALALDKGSALTGCVNQAVDALRADGTLAALQTQWLTKVAGAPVLR